MRMPLRRRPRRRRHRPEPPGAGRPCGTGAGSPGERRRWPRPGDRQGRQPDAAKAPGADGLARSKWLREYVGAGDGRARKRGIVALARKLPVAPWRYATTGMVPEGAVLSPARAEEDNETSGHPGKACDRRGAWLAADRGTVHPDGSRLPERRTARTGIVVTRPASAGQPDRMRVRTRRRARRGAATFCPEHLRAAPNRSDNDRGKDVGRQSG